MLDRLPASLLLFLATAPIACTSPSSTPDATAKFAGTWTYQPGSAIVAQCAGAPDQAIDLSKVPGMNRPGFFMLAAAGNGMLHEVDARGCQYDWSVSDDVASAASGQSCSTFPDGRGGTRLVRMQSGTKTTHDGASLTVDVRFATDEPSNCSIHVQGTATKGEHR
jgi:hypothetical protein